MFLQVKRRFSNPSSVLFTLIIKKYLFVLLFIITIQCVVVVQIILLQGSVFIE